MDIFAAQHRAKLYTLVCLGGTALFLAGLTLGLAATLRAPNVQSQTLAQTPAPLASASTTPALQQAQAVDAIGEAVVHPQAKVRIETRFASCGHVCAQQSENIVGCTKEDISKRFPEHTLTRFSKEEVTLQRLQTGYCPAHLVLMMVDGKTAILQTDAQTLQPVRIIDPTWDVSGADLALLEDLKDGIAFDELSQIDEFIENLES